MDDSGLSKFCAFLLSLVQAENGFASNAISVQISKPLVAIIQNYATSTDTINSGYCLCSSDLFN